MDNIFDQVARIDAVVAFHATQQTEVVEEFTPTKPTVISHYDNDTELTLSLRAVNHLTIDIFSDKHTPGDLIISVLDKESNQITAVVITPELLQTYLNSLPHA